LTLFPPHFDPLIDPKKLWQYSFFTHHASLPANVVEFFSGEILDVREFASSGYVSSSSRAPPSPMNIGAHSGLVDPKHEGAMGSAVWLYLWCLLRQTRRSGLVLGGMPLTYSEISKRSGFPERKVRRWLGVLRVGKYVEVDYLNYKHMKLTVTKAKKFNFAQTSLDFGPSTKNGQSYLTTNGQSVIPKTGDGSTKNGQSKQSGILISTEKPEVTAARPCHLHARSKRDLLDQRDSARRLLSKYLPPAEKNRLQTRLLEIEAELAEFPQARAAGQR
jgi:hypothetical protein